MTSEKEHADIVGKLRQLEHKQSELLGAIGKAPADKKAAMLTEIKQLTTEMEELRKTYLI
jgi:peptidoglycan hydrolase CwlO-like protein